MPIDKVFAGSILFILHMLRLLHQQQQSAHQSRFKIQFLSMLRFQQMKWAQLFIINWDTGAQKTYSAPFSVNQIQQGFDSTDITVTYWAVGAGATEAEKSITLRYFRINSCCTNSDSNSKRRTSGAFMGSNSEYNILYYL